MPLLQLLLWLRNQQFNTESHSRELSRHLQLFHDLSLRVAERV